MPVYLALAAIFDDPGSERDETHAEDEPAEDDDHEEPDEPLR